MAPRNLTHLPLELHANIARLLKIDDFLAYAAAVGVHVRDYLHGDFMTLVTVFTQTHDENAPEEAIKHDLCTDAVFAALVSLYPLHEGNLTDILKTATGQGRHSVVRRLLRLPDDSTVSKESSSYCPLVRDCVFPIFSAAVKLALGTAMKKCDYAMIDILLESLHRNNKKHRDVSKMAAEIAYEANDVEFFTRMLHHPRIKWTQAGADIGYALAIRSGDSTLIPTISQKSRFPIGYHGLLNCVAAAAVTGNIETLDAMNSNAEKHSSITNNAGYLCALETPEAYRHPHVVIHILDQVKADSGCLEKGFCVAARQGNITILAYIYDVIGFEPRDAVASNAVLGSVFYKHLDATKYLLDRMRTFDGMSTALKSAVTRGSMEMFSLLTSYRSQHPEWFDSDRSFNIGNVSTRNTASNANLIRHLLYEDTFFKRTAEDLGTCFMTICVCGSNELFNELFDYIKNHKDAPVIRSSALACAFDRAVRKNQDELIEKALVMLEQLGQRQFGINKLFHTAARYSRIPLLRSMLQSDDRRPDDIEIVSALQDAFDRREYGVIEYLLNESGFSFSTVNLVWCVRRAVISGRRRLFLRYLNDPRMAIDQNGANDLLMLAARSGKLEIIRLLFEHSPFRPDQEAIETAIEIARRKLGDLWLIRTTELLHTYLNEAL